MKPHRLTAILLFCGLTGIFLASASIHTPVRGDAEVMMGVACRIWEHGFGEIPGVPAAQTYSKYGLGQSLLNLPVAPFYLRALGAEPSETMVRLACFLAVALLPAAIGALTATVLYLTLLELGHGPRLSLFAAVAFSLAGYSWVYTQTLFADPTLGLCWLLAFWALLRHRRSGSLGMAATAGFAVGFAALTKIIAAYAIPLFCCYLLWIARPAAGAAPAPRPDRGRALAAFLLPLAFCCLLILWYNRIRGGGWLDFSYASGRDLDFGFNTPLLVGVYGTFFSSGKGFFFYFPAALLGFWGIASFRRRLSAEFWLLLALVAGNILAHATWWGWHGDWAWGLRFLVGLCPFFAILGTETLARILARRREPGAGGRFGRSWPACLAGACLLLSLLVQLPGLCVDVNGYITLVSEHSGFMPHPYYKPAEWPVRDDGPQLRFVPEFSPLAGHFWLLRCLLAGPGPERDKLAERPPWAGLNQRWVPPRAEVEKLMYWNIWWLYGWTQKMPHAGLMLAIGLLAAGGGLACLGGAWRIRRQEMPLSERESHATD